MLQMLDAGFNGFAARVRRSLTVVPPVIDEARVTLCTLVERVAEALDTAFSEHFRSDTAVIEYPVRGFSRSALLVEIPFEILSEPYCALGHALNVLVPAQVLHLLLRKVVLVRLLIRFHLY